MSLDLHVWERHQPISSLGEIRLVLESSAHVLCGSLEETCCLRTFQMKIKRAEVLRVITLLLRLAPAEWNIFFMWLLMLLSSDQQLSELSFILVGLLCSRAHWGLLAFPKLEFSICAFSCSYTWSPRRWYSCALSVQLLLTNITEEAQHTENCLGSKVHEEHTLIFKFNL